MVGLIGSATAQAAVAQVTSGVTQQHISQPGVPSDTFGESVAIQGDFAVIGQPHNGFDGGPNGGGAYLYRHDGTQWILEEELASTLTSHFGQSVAIDGGVIVVGAEEGLSDNGKAFIYERLPNGDWSPAPFQTLLASDGAPDDEFGHSVAVSGSIVMVGAPDVASTQHSSDGTVYVFEKQPITNLWIETEKILPPHPSVGAERFGKSVSLSGERALITGTGHAHNSNVSIGSADIYERQSDGSWSWMAHLQPADCSCNSNQHFGWSGQLDGDRAIVSSSDGAVAVGGKAHIFERQTDGSWLETAAFIASDACCPGFNGDVFGRSVSISGDTVVVGAYLDDDGFTSTGSAWIWKRQPDGEWVEAGKLLASDAALGDRFGTAVAVSGNRVIVGAPDRDENTVHDSGAAYFHELEPWMIARYCETSPNSVGSGARISGTGSGSLAANDLVLNVSGALPNQFGLFFYGPEIREIPFGAGVRCIGGGFFRLNPALLSDASGNYIRPLDNTLPPMNAGAGQLLPGFVWRFQLWYRDPPGGQGGFNLSDALAVAVGP